jgi:hypothetical protein
MQGLAYRTWDIGKRMGDAIGKSAQLSRALKKG